MITEEHVSEEVITPPVPEMVREPLRPVPLTTNGEVKVETSSAVAFKPWMAVLVLPLLFMCGVVGLGSGLLIGWEIWPVEWDVSQYHSALPYNLREDYRKEYIQSLSDLYAFTMDSDTVIRAAGGEAALLPTVCQMMDEASRGGNAPETIRLYAITHILGGCDALNARGE